MIGDRTIKLEEVDSTNTYIKSIIEKCPSETVVVAKRQTNGRGRKGNFWVSDSGGLWFSTLFKPKKRPVNPWHYVRIYSLAIYDVMKKYDVNCIIKWPNDLLIGDKKVCGIVSEAVFKGKSIEAIIVGVGINLNNDIPKELSDIATNLSINAKKEINIDKFLNEVNHMAYNNYYLKYLKDKAVSVITKKWMSLLNIKPGDEVRVKYISGEFEDGTIESITPDYVEIKNKNYEQIKLYAGEISLRKQI